MFCQGRYFIIKSEKKIQGTGDNIYVVFSRCMYDGGPCVHMYVMESLGACITGFLGIQNVMQFLSAFLMESLCTCG